MEQDNNKEEDTFDTVLVYNFKCPKCKAVGDQTLKVEWVGQEGKDYSFPCYFPLKNAKLPASLECEGCNNTTEFTLEIRNNLLDIIKDKEGNTVKYIRDDELREMLKISLQYMQDGNSTIEGLAQIIFAVADLLVMLHPQVKKDMNDFLERNQIYNFDTFVQDTSNIIPKIIMDKLTDKNKDASFLDKVKEVMIDPDIKKNKGDKKKDE